MYHSLRDYRHLHLRDFHLYLGAFHLHLGDFHLHMGDYRLSSPLSPYHSQRQELTSRSQFGPNFPIQFSRSHDPFSSMCRLEAFFSSMILQNGLSSIESSMALIHWSLSSCVAAAILKQKNGER